MFFTGSAGTGKSVLLREIISELRARKRKIGKLTDLALCAWNQRLRFPHAISNHSFDRDCRSQYRRADVTCLVRRIDQKPKSITVNSDIAPFARAGLGLALEDVKTLANRIVRKDQSKKNGDPSVETALDRWTKTQVLIVDESEYTLRHARIIIDDVVTIVSMIDGRFWDKLEAVARIVRKNAKPFGGMQLVLCGE
jgi:ATP-dependent DNA helicase PIF1